MRRRRRKSNIITTIALILSIVMLTVLPLPVAEAANFTVSKSNVSLENGKTSTITINAPTHTGRIDISSSNSAVATVNYSSLWVENDSTTITISANSVGTATITIKGELYDSSTDEEGEFSRTINVTVNKVASSNTNNTATGTTGNSNSGATNGITSSNTSSSQSGSSSNNNQNQTTSTGNSGTSSSKPTNSSTSSTGAQSSNVQNNTAVSTPTEEVVEQEEYIAEEISDETENIQEEIGTEESLEEKEEIDVEVFDAEISNKDQANILMNFNSKSLIIAGIVIIAVAVTGVGIGISKKIFKK